MKSILIIVGVIGLMAVAAFFVTTHVIKPALAPAGPAQAQGGEEADSKRKSPDKKTHDDKDEGTEPGEVYLVSDLLVNPTGTGGTRYLSATVGLEVHAPEVARALEERSVQVRDVLISILSARTVEQLTDFQAREQMRSEIRERLNNLLGSDELSAVYFVDYVLQ